MVPGGGPPQVRALVRKLWLYRPGGRSSGRRVKTTSASSSSSSAPSMESGGGGSSLAKAVLSSAATCGAFSLLSDTMVQTVEIRYRANQRSGEGGASPAPAEEMSKVKAKKFEISKPTQDGEEVVGEVVVVAEPRGESGFSTLLSAKEKRRGLLEFALANLSRRDPSRIRIQTKTKRRRENKTRRVQGTTPTELPECSALVSCSMGPCSTFGTDSLIGSSIGKPTCLTLPQR